jgi:hypothetical protein
MEDEGVMKPTPKAHVVGSNKVLRMLFKCSPIDLDEEMECRGNQWDEYLTKNLQATKNLTHIFIGVEILEFRMASSLESHIIARELHFG